MAKFEPGRSGNPNGRPKGSGEIATLRAGLGGVRATIAKSLPSVVEKLIESAKKGDVQAARLLLERTLPALKPEGRPVHIALPDVPPAAQADAVVRAVCAGTIAPDVGQAVVAMIRAQLDVLEISELADRLAAIEKALESGNGG
jgi:ribosomal protein L17